MGTKECGHQISMSAPSAGEAGATGDWRTSRPVLEATRCLAVKQGHRRAQGQADEPGPERAGGLGGPGLSPPPQHEVACQLCWVYCPDVCITQGVPPAVDLQYCKGCGICAEVCPVDAIRMAPEESGT
jgi:pyruvate ferredoxin oxidoreductase delta subunit